MQRLVTLPADATEKDAKASFFKQCCRSHAQQDKNFPEIAYREIKTLFSLLLFPMTFSILFAKSCSDG